VTPLGAECRLQLRLQVEDKLIGFYREDKGEKLLFPDELQSALQQEKIARKQAEVETRIARSQIEQLQEKSKELGVNLDT
jgi:predicted RNA-binding protein associated with RNAse of E/G family